SRDAVGQAASRSGDAHLGGPDPRPGRGLLPGDRDLHRRARGRGTAAGLALAGPDPARVRCDATVAPMVARRRVPRAGLVVVVTRGDAGIPALLFGRDVLRAAQPH